MQGHTTLLVPTDPAHSLSDSFNQVGDAAGATTPAGHLSQHGTHLQHSTALQQNFMMQQHVSYVTFHQFKLSVGIIGEL